MKRCIVLLVLVIVGNIYADIPQGSFAVLCRKCTSEIRLGDELSIVFKILGRVELVQKKYSNIILNEYRYSGISFSTRNDGGMKQETNSILSIEFNDPSFSLHDGITIGSTKKDVLSKFGTPEEVVSKSYFFYNHEWDLLEMEIIFSSNDLVERIRISMGTE